MLSYAERGRGYVDDAHFLFLLLVRSISFLESHSSVPSLSAVLALQITSNKYCALLLGLVVEAVAGRGIDAFLFSVLLVFSSLAFNTDKILRQFFPRVCPQSGGAVLGVLAFWKNGVFDADFLFVGKPWREGMMGLCPLPSVALCFLAGGKMYSHSQPRQARCLSWGKGRCTFSEATCRTSVLQE